MEKGIGNRDQFADIMTDMKDGDVEMISNSDQKRQDAFRESDVECTEGLIV